MPFRLIVFDLDGTLIDSIGDLAVAVNQVLAELGGAKLETAAIGRMVGEGAAVLMQRALVAAGLEGDPTSALPRFGEVYDAILPGQTRPYAGIPEALATLSERAVLAVLSNKPAGPAVKILEMLGLERQFADIIGGDGPWPRKPSPEGLLHLVGKNGLEPREAVLVGDSGIDLLTARAAGTAVCVARYGFGQDTFDRSLLRGDELFVEAPRDLTRVLAEVTRHR
jgi:phosphoglycolate phosphatase